MIANPEPATSTSTSSPCFNHGIMSVEMHPQPQALIALEPGLSDQEPAACLVWETDMKCVRVRLRCQFEFNPGT